MNCNWLILPTVALFGLLFVLGDRVATTVRTPVGQAAALAAAGVAALPALLLTAYYTHRFDNAAWFYIFRSVPYTELTAAGLGVGAGMLCRLAKEHMAKRQFRLLGLSLPGALLLMCLLVLAAPYAKPMIVPLTVDLQDRWVDGVCLQTTPSTCGPSSAATVLHHLGTTVTERELARECFTCGSGTENWYLARALRRRGFAVDYVVGPPRPVELPFPSIAGTQLGSPGGAGHYIAILGRDGSSYIVGDPLSGKTKLTWDELCQRYYLTGFFMVIRRVS